MKLSIQLKSMILSICLLWISNGPIFAVTINTGMEELVKGNNSFCFDLYQQLKKEKKGNIFFSPYSISTALAMTYAGARGTTEKEMAEVLHFTLPQEKLHPAFFKLFSNMQTIQNKGNVELNVANSLWIQKNFNLKTDFLKTTGQFYKASPFPVNFIPPDDREKARKKINRWVEEKTNNKIKNLIPGGILNNLTRLILTNAIYFKGCWASRFNKNRTQKRPFWITSNQKEDVDVMFQVYTFRYMENNNIQVLEMPYKGKDLSMLVFLPRKKYGINKLEQELNSNGIKKWISSLSQTKVLVYFPKFKITCPFRMKKTLQSMGMRDAFSRSSNFSGITDIKSEPLQISEVIHKAFIEVNEEGTEAAAATAVIMKKRVSISTRPRIPVFKADHPFVFVIRDNKSGSILFVGRLSDPS